MPMTNEDLAKKYLVDAASLVSHSNQESIFALVGVGFSILALGDVLRSLMVVEREVGESNDQ